MLTNKLKTAAGYEAMLDELELLRDVQRAERQVAAGKGRSQAAVARALRSRLAR